MAGFLWRVLIAVICVVLLYAILPPFFAVVGFAPDANVMRIIRIVIAGLAVLYAMKGDRVL